MLSAKESVRALAAVGQTRGMTAVVSVGQQSIFKFFTFISLASKTLSFSHSFGNTWGLFRAAPGHVQVGNWEAFLFWEGGQTLEQAA